MIARTLGEWNLLANTRWSRRRETIERRGSSRWRKVTGKTVAFATFASSMSSPCFGKHQTAYRSRHAPRDACRHCSVFAARLAACAVCLSLRAVFRVCHDLLSVFGFGCNFLCEARIFGAAMYAPSS